MSHSKINMPSDMFFLFFIRMDDLMIDTLLDQQAVYMGMDCDSFSAYLTNNMQQHRVINDTSLLAHTGKFDNNTKSGISFIGNHSKQRFNLIVELNEQKEIVNFTENSDFQFDEYIYSDSAF